MTFGDYCRRLLPKSGLSAFGPQVQEFHRYMSTTFYMGDGRLPAEYSKLWKSKEWSYTGTDPNVSSYVYVLGRPDNYLKIGVSCDPIRRVAELSAMLQCRIWIIAMWLHHDKGNVEQTVRQLLRSDKHPIEAEWYAVSEKKMLATVAKAMRLVEKGQGKYLSHTTIKR